MNSAVPPRPQPRSAPSPVSTNEVVAAGSSASNGDFENATPADVPPVKPERKNRKGPPKLPTPYATTAKKTVRSLLHTNT